MDKKEAIQAMLDGKILHWKGSRYVYRFNLEINGMVFERAIKLGNGLMGEWEAFHVNSLGSAQCFTEYQEPKRKVKFYQYYSDAGEVLGILVSDCGLICSTKRKFATEKSDGSIERCGKKIQNAFVEIEV